MADINGVCKLSNSSSLVADLKSFFSFIKTKSKKVCAYGFMLSFVACTAFFVFNSSGGNSIWFTNFFSSNSTETGSSSRSFFYYILPDPNNPSASAKLDDSFNFSRSGARSSDLANGTVSGDIYGNATKSKVSTEISTRNGTDFVVIKNNPAGSSQVSTEISGDTTSVGTENVTDSAVIRNNRAGSIFGNATKVVTKNGTDSVVLKSNSTKNSEIPVKNQSDVPRVLDLTSVLRRNKTISTGKVVSVDRKESKVPGDCDIFDGKWVRDESYPLYPTGSCPYIDEPFDCFLNHRPDNDYQKYRWQPKGCNIPRLNATDMLERLRGKRLVFVGDSLNRNMWESLVCVLRNSIRDKENVFEASGKSEFRTEGFYSIRFKDYNCSVEFFRAPFLVQEWEIPSTNGTAKETLRLDIIEKSSFKFKDSDILVFNTGHWWTHEKTSKGKDYYQEGNRIYSELNVLEAYRKALRTWANWVDSNINPKKTHVFFRGYSASHFRGGQWNSGGQCHTETEPITNDKFIQPYPSKMKVVESVISEMKTPISYLNITRMTDYRKDAHPSIYRKQSLTEEERLSPERFQDCSHWCLPGLPDTWNELLYAKLLMTHQ